MKALDVISYFDKFRPNIIEFSVKKDWVFKLESDIRQFCVEHTSNKPDMSFILCENPLLFLTEQDKDIYIYYLASMMDMANGEYNLYNISSTYFNSLFGQWKRKYRSCHTPVNITTIKL